MKVVPKDMSYLLYARKSTESEERQAESIPAQLDILTKLAKEKELSISKVFKESKSAKAPGREEFNKMVALIEKGGVRGILVWKLNRLFRNPQDEGTIRWLLASGKIEEIVTPTKIYKEADSDFLMAIEGSQAQRFIRDLREDTQRGIQRKLDRGLAPIFAPVGYKNDMTLLQGERDIKPHPVYFELLRQIFNLALTGNYSVGKLHKRAKEMGILNGRGKVVSISQVYRVLTNPFYKGEFYYAGRVYRGSHKPMISFEEYETLQKILAQRSRPRSINHEWNLTGLIRCEVCGRQLTCEEHIKKSGKVFTYYKCSGKYKAQCPSPYVPAGELEAQAYAFLGRIKLSSRFVTWAIKVLKRATDEEKLVYKEKYNALRIEQDQVKERLYNLQMRWATQPGSLDEEVYQRGTTELRERRDQIYRMLQGEDKDFDLTTDLAVATFKFASKAQEKWEQGNPAYKKGIMRVVGSSLIFTKEGNLDIKPRTPFLLIEKALSEAKVQSTLKSENPGLNPSIEAKLGTDQKQSLILGG